MEINFPFVYSGKKYSSDEFYNLFVCSECGAGFKSKDGKIVCRADSSHTGIFLLEEGGTRMENKMPVNLDEITTLTGMKIVDAITKLNERLEDKAYKEIPMGKFKLTDISPAYLIEKLTEIFGPCGIGWMYSFDKDDINCSVVSEQWQSTVIGFQFYYTVVWNGEAHKVGPVLSTGGNRSPRNIEHALKGSVTNALGNAAHRLGWQVDVYKGLRTEEGDFESGTKQTSAPTISFVDAASMHYKLDTEKAIAASGADYAPAIQYNLVRSLDENTPASKLAEMIGEEAAKATKHTLAELMGLAKCEWAITTELFGKPAKDITLGEFCSMWTAFVRIINGEKKETVVKQYQDMTGKK